MAIQVVLAASPRKYVPGYNSETGYAMTVEAGSTVRDLAGRLGIPEEEVKLMMVDGLGAKWEKPLNGNERVALFPPVGGGWQTAPVPRRYSPFSSFRYFVIPFLALM